jgi:hypothetical protein
LEYSAPQLLQKKLVFDFAINKNFSEGKKKGQTGNVCPYIKITGFLAAYWELLHRN